MKLYEDTEMDKSKIMAAVAAIAIAVPDVAMAVAAAQKSAYTKLTSTSAESPTDHIIGARRKLQDVDRETSELLSMLNNEHAGDPLSMDDFDVEDFGAKLEQIGLIANYDDTVASALGKIESDGFASYLEDFKSKISALDQTFDMAGKKIDTWAKLGADDRVAAIAGNTDDNVLPVLAKLKVDATNFDSFAQVGLMTFAQLSYIDQGVGSLTSVAAASSKTETAEPVEA